MRVLLSVYDKTGLVDFARGLIALGAELFSTGGTQRALQEAGLPVGSVSEITGFPEILEGRVKTLHPAVYGGILARRDKPEHMAELAQHGLTPIDLVAVNLYPFVQTIARSAVGEEEAQENIDIGGPTMLRAAAKNYLHVLVVVDPADYAPVLEALRDGGPSSAERRRLAQKAFQHTASYDTAIAGYLRAEEDRFPAQMTLALTKIQDLRYGENPHQQAAFYKEESRFAALRRSLAAAEQLGGKELSYNNILDLDSAWNIVVDFSAPTATIVKHNNPCGLASNESLTRAFGRALTGDPVSAFGGIVGFNRRVDVPTAQAMRDTFFEAVVAPGYEEEALKVLRRRKDLRIVAMPASVQAAAVAAPEFDFRRVSGGFLVQAKDELPEDANQLQIVTERKPTLDELTDLLFAWRAVKHVKSNAIVLAKGLCMLGMGAGQPNRVVSVEIALKKAGEKALGSVLASDAFFPFPDGVEAAARGGVTAIIQPGGSIRDEDVLRVANEHHMAMVFTGRRHFRH